MVFRNEHYKVPNIGLSTAVRSRWCLGCVHLLLYFYKFLLFLIILFGSGSIFLFHFFILAFINIYFLKIYIYMCADFEAYWVSVSFTDSSADFFPWQFLEMPIITPILSLRFLKSQLCSRKAYFVLKIADSIILKTDSKL